ncbi:HNH endonuclease [Alkalicella caledoniensis]|uniref:HNH endonuclease n=1 Tax=Alkalicella caledoniensis TaxID=2731377 RepID=A0A7G9W8C9_ALKCA|nr:HNH endonuclease [Alkalicella caledoniensis]QNO14941.1 HNH endonuclease [Alkalicella caledoniensis]
MYVKPLFVDKPPKLTKKQIEKVKQIVRENADGYCQECDHWFGEALEFHHIVFQSQGGRDTIENGIMLCHGCHRGTNGVHGKNGRELDLKLKLKLQDYYFDQGLSEDIVRVLMGGKLYP